jgi:hypothetical protein
MAATTIWSSGLPFIARTEVISSATGIRGPSGAASQSASGVEKGSMGGALPPQRCPTCAQRKLPAVPISGLRY